MNTRALTALLAEHPDRSFAGYVCSGFTSSFRIGFNYQDHSCRPAKRNMLSVKTNPTVVEEYLHKEIREGRIARVEGGTGLADLQISAFGVIPKKNSDLIVDLSVPEGFSVNRSA